MKKTVLFGLLVILLAFGFIGCDNGNGNEDEFTVTFNLDEGKIGDSTANVIITVKSGESISELPNPTKNENTFDGWFTQKNGGGNSFTSSTAVTSDLTVYAKWKLNSTESPYAGDWVMSSPEAKFVINGDLTFSLWLQGTESARGNIEIEGTTATITYTSLFKSGNWITDPIEVAAEFGPDGILGDTNPIVGTITGSSIGSILLDNFVKQ